MGVTRIIKGKKRERKKREATDSKKEDEWGVTDPASRPGRDGRPPRLLTHA